MNFIKIRKIGDSLVATIPNEIVKNLNIKSGMYLQIDIIEGKIVSKVVV